MPGYWQISVTKLESSLKGSLRLTDVQLAALVVRHNIHNIAQLAIERHAHRETGARFLHLLIRVQERASSTAGLITWVEV